VKVEKKPIKLKCKKKKVIIKSKVEKNDRANKRKTTKNGKLKAVV